MYVHADHLRSKIPSVLTGEAQRRARLSELLFGRAQLLAERAALGFRRGAPPLERLERRRGALRLGGARLSMHVES